MEGAGGARGKGAPYNVVHIANSGQPGHAQRPVLRGRRRAQLLLHQDAWAPSPRERAATALADGYGRSGNLPEPPSVAARTKPC